MALSGYAQHYLGVSSDGWSGFNTLYLNPANIAGREERLIINLFSENMAVDNNIGVFSKFGNVGTALNGRGYDSISNLPGQAKLNMLAPSATLRGPGLMITLNERNTLALTTGVRAVNQYINFDQAFYNALTTSGYVPAQNNNFSTKNFSWSTHAWSEVGLTYAVVLAGPGRHQLNAGITLRYLSGIGYISMKGKNVNVDLAQGADSFYAWQSDVQYASNIMTSANAITNNMDASQLVSRFMTSTENVGFGGDLGFTYFFRPQNYSQGKLYTGNAFKFRLSASVTDFGAIQYRENTNHIVNVSGNAYLTGKDLILNTRNFRDFTDYSLRKGLRTDSSNAALSINLPAKLLISADYQIYDKFYLNATYLANLIGRQEYGNGYYDQVTIVPRYDSRFLGIGIPVTYSLLSKTVKAGIGLRLSGLFIGSDDLLTLVGGSSHGFGFYGGLYLPIYKKKPTGDNKLD